MKYTGMRFIGLSLVLSLVCFVGTPWAIESSAKELEGTWYGILEFAGVKLRVIFHIHCPKLDACAGTVDSPDQGAEGIPLSKAGMENGKVRFECDAIAGKFLGSWKNGNETLVGDWIQGGARVPLELKRTPPPKNLRPQEPKPPFPYEISSIEFPGGDKGVRLSGTLTKPKGPGPFPAIVLVSGSGPQDRDESVFGHRPFLVLADYLTRRGWVVLRYDDRGVAQSTGTFTLATTEDFARDALAAVNYLSSTQNFVSDPIGILGHSEGAIVAIMVASQNPRVSFIVLISGPAVPGYDIILKQTELISRHQGMKEPQLEKVMNAQRQLLDLVRDETDSSSLRDKVRMTLRESIKNLPEESEDKELNEKILETQVEQILSPWFRFFIRNNPATVLEKVRQPVLALYGEKDLQVPPEQNIPPLAATLEKAKHPDFQIVKLPGLNHLMQSAETGGLEEYARIEETFSPRALKVIGDWLDRWVSQGK